MECACTGEMDLESMEVYLGEYCVKTLAKGKVEQGYRLFLYGTEVRTWTGKRVRKRDFYLFIFIFRILLVLLFLSTSPHVQEESTEPVLAELIVDVTKHTAKATIKTELPEEYIAEFANLLDALCSAV
jgi:hypothetical protein